MEHVDFAIENDVNCNDFEDFGDTDSLLISRVSIRGTNEDDIHIVEVFIFLLSHFLYEFKVIFLYRYEDYTYN